MVYDSQKRRPTVKDRLRGVTTTYTFRNASFKRSNTTTPQTWTLTSVGDWSNWKNFSTTAVARTHGATAVVYIHAGQQTVCDYTRGANANTTPAFRYEWGDYIDEPILFQTGSSTLLYNHHNQQYSTVALTNSSGEVISRYGYTAYGEQSILTYTGSSQSYSSYANRYTYTGREWDDSLKAHYFRARWYDAALGRFVNRDPIGYVDGMSLYGGYFANVGLDPQGTRIGIVDASFVDHSNASGLCGDRYSWEQRLDIYWIGIPKGKNRYGFAEIFGISVRNGAIVQNVRHEFSCASCDCPMDVVSGEFNFWEWFGMEIPPDRFNLPGKWSVGPFESRLYGTDIHFMQYAPPVTNFPDPQLVCFSSIRVTTYLGTTFGTNGWWGPLAFPFPQNVPDWVNTGHVSQGIAFPEDRGHDWGFDVSSVGGRCIRVNKFGF
jgi:RHS repeat-associated protein